MKGEQISITIPYSILGEIKESYWVKAKPTRHNLSTKENAFFHLTKKVEFWMYRVWNADIQNVTRTRFLFT